ncbi:MAG: carboxypeptidase-like regulatory domain-containing protein, partial [Acidobacteria bacterium]|nr:carboxypeptidase-like regulatory domain-containing protein [Acidobacteriota bacterium]
MNRIPVRFPPRPAIWLAAASLALLILVSSGESFAQVTGKVIGTVTDRDTGQPLVGAQVVVENTNLGNVT